jgi:hypothetical protein
MNPAYIETFRRHRVLFLVPVALAGMIALWAAFGAQKQYRSTTGLWVDTAGGASYQVVGAPSPAADAQTMLNELLRTEYFDRAVAKQSPLEAYLDSNPSAGWGPAAVIAKLRRTPALTDRIAAALGPSHVTSTVQGPHVLEITFDAASPELALATLRVLVRQFQEQRATFDRDALTAARLQVTAATNALDQAHANVQEYLGLHPTSTSLDRELGALTLAERQAAVALSGATRALRDASTALFQGGTFATTLRVLDEPRLPLGPTQGKRRLALSFIAGLFGGAIFSVIGVVVLTTARRAVHVLDAASEATEHPSENGHHMGGDKIAAPTSSSRARRRRRQRAAQAKRARQRK